MILKSPFMGVIIIFFFFYYKKKTYKQLHQLASVEKMDKYTINTFLQLS